jgi:ornithine cyclodeaminase/thiomorpholine-carboxylate dehydrogenase
LAHASVDLLTLSGADIMRLVDPARLVDALAAGFKALSRGDVQAPPRPKVEVPGKGFSLAMLAAAPDELIACKIVNVFDGNHAIGLASHQAIVALFSRDTGVPVAVLDGASLTGLRTAACAILSVRELARPDARIAAVIGGGVQGVEHARQLAVARKFQEIRVFARSPEAAARVAAAAPATRIVASVEAAVRGADVVCLTTSAATPVLDAAWVGPGTHVTSVGFAPPGSELPKALIDRAAIFVEAKSAFQAAPVGCAELAGMDPARGAELGEVLLGTRPGRSSADQITLWKSMGSAMEDMVAANLAYRAAIAAGAGTKVVI